MTIVMPRQNIEKTTGKKRITMDKYMGEQFLAVAGTTAGAPTVREDIFAACQDWPC